MISPGEISTELRARLGKVRCLLLDVDGVLTDGQLHYDDHGREFKSFDIQDGHGLALVKQAGLLVGVISGRDSAATSRRAAELGIELLFQGAREKGPVVEQIKHQRHLADEQLCAVGDDLLDLPVLRRAGVAIAVANAVDEVKAAAHYITRRAGGHGAVREVAELLLKAQGRWAELTADEPG